MAGVRWQYSGTIRDALIEFAEVYTFSTGRMPKDSREHLEVKRAHSIGHSRDYIVTSSNILLEEIVKMVSH